MIDAADYAKPYAEYVEKEEARITQLLHQAGSELIMLETTQNYKDLLTKAFVLRKKRWWA